MARETDAEERARKDQEKIDVNRARQVRLGQVPASTSENEEVTEAPKSRSRSRKKS